MINGILEWWNIGRMGRQANGVMEFLSIKSSNQNIKIFCEKMNFNALCGGNFGIEIGGIQVKKVNSEQLTVNSNNGQIILYNKI